MNYIDTAAWCIVYLVFSFLLMASLLGAFDNFIEKLIIAAWKISILIACCTFWWAIFNAAREVVK